MFMFVQNPLLETIFGRSKCPSILKNAFFDRFLICPASQNRPLKRHVRPQSRQKGSPTDPGERPAADLDSIWRRKRSKDAFVSIWDRFLIDFGRICDELRMEFQWFSTYLGCHFWQDSVTDFSIYLPRKCQTANSQAQLADSKTPTINAPTVTHRQPSKRTWC